MHDVPRTPGIVRAWLLDAATGLFIPGSFVESRNKTTKAGRALISEALQPGNPNFGLIGFAKIGVGDGRTAPDVNDAALESELARKAIKSFDNANLANEPPTFVADIQLDTSEAVSNRLSEVGFYLNDAGETLYGRALFGQGAVEGATQANPVVITSTGHGLIAGERVWIEGVGGQTQLNQADPDLPYTVANPTADTYELQGVDGTAHDAFTTAGTWTKVIPKTAAQIGIFTYTTGFQV